MENNTRFSRNKKKDTPIPVKHPLSKVDKVCLTLMYIYICLFTLNFSYIFKLNTTASSFGSIFNSSTDSKTYAESLNYARKLIVIGISNIAYLRTVMPEDCFLDREFEGLNIKILNKLSKNTDVKRLQIWLAGAFEAMEKKYVS